MALSEPTLAKADFYLAHPIGRRHSVRDRLQAGLKKLGITSINPFYGPDGEPRDDIAELDRGLPLLALLGSRNTAAKCRIVIRDLKYISQCRAIVAYLPMASMGTSMELFYAAYVHRKPVYVISNTPHVVQHPWIKTFASHIDPSIRAFLRRVKGESWWEVNDE